MNRITRNWKHWMGCLLGCLLAASVTAQTEAQAGDEVRIEHQSDSTRSASVLIGDPMRVWTNAHKRHTARLKSVKDSSFVLGDLEIPVGAVVKIKAYSKEIGSQRMKAVARRSAWTFVGGAGASLLGVALLVLAGTGARVVAILALLLGLSVAAVCLLLLAGVLVALIGGNIPATSFPMERGWRLRLIRRQQ